MTVIRGHRPVVDDEFLLTWAGFMGHPFAVTEDSGNSGDRRMVGECNDLETASRWAAEHTNGRVYQRTKKGYRVVKLKVRS